MQSSNQFPKSNPKKPTTGKLWYNGKVIMDHKPFPVLQNKKKQLLATGYYKKELFKLSY